MNTIADPTLILVATTAALPREGEVVGERISGLLDAMDAQKHTAAHLKGLVRSLLTDVEQARNHKRPYQMWPNGRLFRELSSAVRDVESAATTANFARREPGQRQTPEELRLRVERLTKFYHDLKVDLAKRDAEIVVRKRDRDHLKAENAAQREQISNQAGTIGRLTAELAKRDETIAAQGKSLLKGVVTLNALREDRDVLRRNLEERDASLANFKAANRVLDTYRAEVVMLRSQLARVGAIEAKANEVLRTACLKPLKEESWSEWYAVEDQAIEKLMAALASPSPGSHATPEGDQQRASFAYGCSASASHNGGVTKQDVVESAVRAKLNDVVAAADHLIDSVPDWKPGDGLEAALIDGGPIISLACALACLRVASWPRPKEQSKP